MSEPMDRTILADDLEALPWWEHMIAVLALCAIVVLSSLLAVFDGARDE